MFQLYTVLLLILCLAFTNSIDTTKSSSRSIYDLLQNRRVAAFKNKTDRLYDDNNNNTTIPQNILREKSHERILSERVKLISIISSISVGIMAIIVITYIALQYARNQRIKASKNAEQSIPLNTTRKIAHSSKKNDDRRNVPRKTRT